MDYRRTTSRAAAALRERELSKARDKAAEYHRTTQRVVLFTTHTWIEGTIYYPERVRLSDALNSPASQQQRYVPLKDVVVRDARDGQVICRAGVMMVHHRHIVGIIPEDELQGCSAFEGSACGEPGHDCTR